MKRLPLTVPPHKPGMEDDVLREYNGQIEKFVRSDMESGRFREAWFWVIEPEQRKTHSSRNQAERVGLACLRGLGGDFERVGFVVRQTWRKTGWRLLFFVTDQPA